MSPGWIRLPSSSHTEMAMLPLLSATLHERTSCPSFVLVTRPETDHTHTHLSDLIRTTQGTLCACAIKLVCNRQRKWVTQQKTEWKKKCINTHTGPGEEEELSFLLSQLTYFQNYKDDMQVFRSRLYIFDQARGVAVKVRHRLNKNKRTGRERRRRSSSSSSKRRSRSG